MIINNRPNYYMIFLLGWVSITWRMAMSGRWNRHPAPCTPDKGCLRLYLLKNSLFGE